VSEATGPVYKVAFRRRRSNITNYAKRLALVKGTAPRMVVRKSTTGVLVQFLEFSANGDKVVASVHSPSLSQFGWAPRCNSPTAYLCGMLAGKLAAKKGAKEFNLDIGMYTPSKGSLLFAALRGAVDAGLKTNYTEEMITDDRITGAAIAAYAKSLKSSDESKYKKLFSSYLKDGFEPEKMVEKFNAAKSKISTQ
jgi:large subunit ribosomal protein L18